MSFHRPTLHELSAHEAGHAYAFAALRWSDAPEEIGIDVDAHGNPHGWSRRATMLHKEVRLDRVDVEALPAVEWQAAAEVVVALAGPLAEFRHRHRSRDAAVFLMLDNAAAFLRPGAFDDAGDFESVRSTLRYIRSSDAVAAFRTLADISHEIVCANWPSIRGLASRIRERRLLDADDVADWFEAHPARRFVGFERLRTCVRG